MPSFCRHNRLLQNCPICSREQAVEARPLISSSAPRSTVPRTPSPDRRRSTGGRGRGTASPSSSHLRVRRLQRGHDDGFRTSLGPGLRSSVEAHRLAAELAFAAWRLEVLGSEPPGLFAEVAAAGDLEERTWLAFLIALLDPLDEGDPFAAIDSVRTSWHSGEVPGLEAVTTGPRGPRDPAASRPTLQAYRRWAQRAGSQAAAFTGDPGWSGERRLARIFERLALPGLHREARFELLTGLGRMGVYDLRAGSLFLGGEGLVTVAAKRVFGIGDPLLLERRAAALAEACELPLEALDRGLFSWERGVRSPGGVALPEEDVIAARAATVEEALGL